MNSPVIKPTVGRVVWFYPSQNTAEAGFARHPDGGGPYAALIAHVWNDHMVNLSVFDANGAAHPRTSVPMLHGECDVPEHAFCGWMPYQKGQAAKTDAAEKGIVLEPKYREPTQREQLEYALVSGAASALAISPGNARQVVDGINVVLDTLHPLPTLSNPHTGTPRDPRDVASDPQAILCVKPGEPLKASTIVLPVVDSGPDSLEREIQAKADNGPRVTPADIEANIASEHYFTAADGARMSPDGNWPIHSLNTGSLGLLTFCVLVLRNGFTVVGHSACASPENYNKEIGERIARENAEREIWPLLGFRLRDELARPVLTDADAAADLAGTTRPT